jgi:hypothetical protein
VVSNSEPEPSAARELASFFAGLAVVVLLAAACTLAPLAAMVFSPWFGVAVAVGSLWVWGRFGPRPCPGLLPGTLCLWGYAAIFGSLLGCVALAVRGLLV